MTRPSPPEPADAGVGKPRTRMRVFVATAVVALLADLISKLLVVAHIKPEDAGVRLLGGAVYLVQTRNSGAAFSVGTGATVVLTAISVIVVVVIARAARRLTSRGWAIALGLVLGGALGNLTDRFFRAPSPGKGHVVDWISLFANDGHVWPIFNLADSSIVVGGVTAVALSLLGVDFNGARGRDVPLTGLPHTDAAAEDRAPEQPAVSEKPASSDG